LSTFDREHQQVQAALAALTGPEGDALLAHVQACAECSRGFAEVQDALLAVLYLPPPRSLDAGRSETVRERLLGRVGGAAPAPAPAAAAPPPRRPLVLVGAGGWLVAAGLATMLLTHHSFHRPLQFGWIVASALGAALLGAALYLLGERRRSVYLRERLAALELELSRIRAHAMGGEQAYRTA
jgi:hypothetical protein